MEESREAPQKPRPLLPVSLIVAAILILPALLYSLAPDEPLREGVVVFSDGKQRVYLMERSRYQAYGYTDRCVLEPQEQMVVLQKPADRPDRAFLARFEGKTALQFPFCPPLAQIIVKRHQVVQKQGVWHELGERTAHFFRR